MSELFIKLIAGTGLSAHDVRRILSNAPIRYKVFQVPKRKGGFREIAQPAREVKMLQRVIAQEVLSTLPVHPAAMAYVKGKNIKDNAAQHAGSRVIMKMDFENFFPSITASDWQKYCDESGILPDVTDRNITTKLLFYRKKGSSSLRLSIGAPTSPALSNVIMYAFDETLTERLKAEKIHYTRYADDLTFSAPRTGFLNAVPAAVRQTLREMSFPTLKVNETKTVVATTKYKRQVTGLILANDGRVTIGRDKKREIHAAVHSATLGHLDAAALYRLSGLLAHVNAVEPSFLMTIERRYGAEILNELKRMPRNPLRRPRA